MNPPAPGSAGRRTSIPAFQEVNQGYADDGRLASVGIMHGGTEQRFAYGYLAGSGLLASLAMPDGIVRELSYEQRRDLISGIDCRLGETVLVSRSQSCDALGRPVTRTQRRGTEPARSDSFSYNGRNELTGAALGAAPYGYSYDNIGNRKTAQEPAGELAYAANELNQYTRIEENAEAPFAPQYDASGNQTLIRTSTGIWTVAYNAANRATSFTSHDGATIVKCGYDYQGRRYMKKVTVNDTVASHERYLYRGYLQADLDMINSRNVRRTLLWDPLEPTATRPLALVQGASLYCYGWDFNKNVTEVFDGDGSIAAAYDYSPYGQAASTGSLVQPVQWSSEMHDEDFALVYYNYRYYNPRDGRWINRDPIAEQGGWNLYAFVGNMPILKTDTLGRQFPPGSAGVVNNWINNGLKKGVRTQGLAQCNAVESYVGESCCVITYCILRLDRAFYKNIQGFLTCCPCRDIQNERDRIWPIKRECPRSFTREFEYIPVIPNKK